MNMQRNARGITLIGFLVMLCVLGFFAYMVMRLMPVYVEYFGVLKAMEMVKNEPGAAQKSIEEIRREIMMKFNTQYVDETDVPPQAIQLRRDAGASTLRIAYEKRVPFMYNIDLVASFDKSVNLTNAGAE
jgi:type III secretory pathway component EscU